MGKEFDNMNAADKSKKGGLLSAIITGVAVVSKIATTINNNAKISDIDRQINDINSKILKMPSDKKKLNELREERDRIRK